jgi:hypothetical protein
LKVSSIELSGILGTPVGASIFLAVTQATARYAVVSLTIFEYMWEDTCVCEENCEICQHMAADAGVASVSVWGGGAFGGHFWPSPVERPLAGHTHTLTAGVAQGRGAPPAARTSPRDLGSGVRKTPSLGDLHLVVNFGPEELHFPNHFVNPNRPRLFSMAPQSRDRNVAPWPVGAWCRRLLWRLPLCPWYSHTRQCGAMEALIGS